MASELENKKTNKNSHDKKSEMLQQLFTGFDKLGLLMTNNYIISRVGGNLPLRVLMLPHHVCTVKCVLFLALPFAV